MAKRGETSTDNTPGAGARADEKDGVDLEVGGATGDVSSATDSGSQIAVAVHQDKKTDEAPRVVAKGHGTIAEQILEIAFAHGVNVREDAALAEILEAVDVDSEIPLEALAAVAEIMTYVYRANADLETVGDDADKDNSENTP